jgi:glyoxylase-like metal-dependent hydrolase (beta-lactamase superfamily II)
MSDDVHEVYAVRYAHHDRQSSENFIGGDPHNVLQPLDYYIWLIKGAHGSFVVDSGFDGAMAKRRGRHITKPAGEGLKALGVDPSAIKDVIVTHLHYDHVGNHDVFPHARYHLQDKEMGFATGRHMCHAHMRVPFEADDVVAMVRKVFAGRVKFHDGDEEIAPGIGLHWIGGHSMGLQCVRVKTRRGHVVLASDATHLYAHMEQGRVYPVTFNVADVLAGYETLNRLATSVRHIVPGHDPKVLQRYPAAAPGLENWIVRLDADPNARDRA